MQADPSIVKPLIWIAEDYLCIIVYFGSFGVYHVVSSSEDFKFLNHPIVKFIKFL